MKNKLVLSLAAAALIAAPAMPASAHDWHHGYGHGGGPSVRCWCRCRRRSWRSSHSCYVAVSSGYSDSSSGPGLCRSRRPVPAAYPAPVVYGYAPAYYAPRPVAVYGYPGYYGHPHYGYARVGYYGHRY